MIQLEQLRARLQEPAPYAPLFVPLFQGDESSVPLRISEEVRQFRTLADFLLDLLNGEMEVFVRNFTGGMVDLDCWCVLHT